MIDSREKLRDVLAYEKSLYFPNKKDYITAKLVSDQHYHTWRYIIRLRKTEYYLNCYKRSNSIIKRVLWMIWRRRKNCLGNKLGIEISENSFDKGLLIWHAGGIVVNGNCKIGKDCILHGSVCMGNDGITYDAPILGNNVDIGAKVCVIGKVKIANKVVIGAGSIVIRSLENEGETYVGVPARLVSRKGA